MAEVAEVSKPAERAHPSGRAASGVIAKRPPPAASPYTSASPLSAGRAFTALTKIREGQSGLLTEYLTGLGKDIDGSLDMLFDQVKTVHFMRWVVITDTNAAPWLAFESNYDGELETHLEELLTVGGAALHRIYRHCDGYPLADSSAVGPDDASVLATYLTGASLPIGAFHVGVHRKTAERIRRESKVRDAIQIFLDEARAESDFGSLAPEEIYARIERYLESQGEPLLTWAREMQPPLPESSALPVVVRAWPLVFAAVLALPVLLLKEVLDPEDPPIAEPPRIGELEDREDFQVQNQLTHLVDVKPGILRQLTLRAVLWVINLLAEYKYNQGALGGITTIHFARWVFTDDRKRLLFFSNFDGSWESYLGDFIDKAAKGLTGVWSNTKGFPKTVAIVFKGATDEERFKSWTRAHQIPTQLWYSAYPELTVFNVKQNAEVCEGLAKKPATRKDMLDWLAKL